MDLNLKGKRVLVTGVSGGIGRAIAEAFAAEGARVAVHARRQDQAKEAAAQIADAVPVSADLSDPDAVRAMAAAAIDGLGGLDILINNAGLCETAPIEAMDDAVWARALAVNATACFILTKACVPAIKASGRGGSVLFVSSTSDKDAAAEYCAYNASKHAVRGMMRCLAVELAPHGIRANCIAPGWVETPMAERARDRFTAKGRGDRAAVSQQMRDDNMMGEIIPPRAIADMAMFLASDRGGHVTAQSVSVCAGTTHW